MSGKERRKIKCEVDESKLRNKDYWLKVSLQKINTWYTGTIKILIVEKYVNKQTVTNHYNSNVASVHNM